MTNLLTSKQNQTIMVKIENTKRTIMNMAEALLQDKGFNGFSYANIASELGVKNAASAYAAPAARSSINDKFTQSLIT